MPNRLRLIDFRNSRGPRAIGLCNTTPIDPRLIDAVNTAQRRLLVAVEAGDEGWYGTWAHMVFNVTVANPLITLPREVARLERVEVNHHTVPVQNQFYEFLQLGAGYAHSFPGWGCRWNDGMRNNLLARNNSPTFVDLAPAPQNLYLYPANAQDAGAVVFLQGLDNNGLTLTSTDADGNVLQGISLTLAFPFVACPVPLNQITGIQKPFTFGSVSFVQSDPNTAAQVTLLVMEPGEMVASYRRYFFHGVPRWGASTLAGTFQVQAIAKLELVPAVVDSDYLLIQNLEALIEECQAVRYSTMDTPEAKQMAAAKHKEAIGYLQGELVHYLGKERPAFSFRPFGSDDLTRINIGMI